jgi:hypothetical protein
MEMENNQPITPTKRVVEVLIDEKGNPHEGEVVKNVLTFETLDLPTLDEVVDKTKPDFDDFDVLHGKMGVCDEFTEFTKVFYYKEKVNPPVNGKDYRIKQLPKYPKFLALFEGKETINDITLFDVNRMFNKEQFDECLKEDEHKNALTEAAAEIMQNMKKENRFSFDTELKESDIAILQKWIKNTDGFLYYGDLLADSFREMLPDFTKLGEECENPIDFNQEDIMFMPPMEQSDYGDDEESAGDISSFMPTPGGWNIEAD